MEHLFVLVRDVVTNHGGCRQLKGQQKTRQKVMTSVHYRAVSSDNYLFYKIRYLQYFLF